MALARLALKNLRSRVLVSSSPAPAASSFFSHQSLLSVRSISISSSGVGLVKQQSCWSSELVKRFTTTTTSDDPPAKLGGREVAVSEGSSTTTKKSNLFPKRKTRRGLWWSRNNKHRDLVPSLSEIFPSGLGNAIVEAAHNMNRLLENLSPSHLTGRFKEKDECYKVKYQMPGLSKEDVKITIEDDGILVVRGEHKVEEEEGSDDEHWSSYASHGYYNTSLLLPEDAKIDEIKAEMKDGVLCINIPKAQGKKKDVKEVHLH